MLLERKNAVIYGAGGAIGGTVARAFAREGGAFRHSPKLQTSPPSWPPIAPAR